MILTRKSFENTSDKGENASLILYHIYQPCISNLLKTLRDKEKMLPTILPFQTNFNFQSLISSYANVINLDQRKATLTLNLIIPSINDPVVEDC